MALNIRSGPTEEPLRVMLYGQEGVGKTTWAVGCPHALFITAEDGGGDIDYQRVVVDSWPELLGTIAELTKDPQGFRTIVIDTIDKFEAKLHRTLCSAGSVDSIEAYDGGYGKGFTAAKESMEELSSRLDNLRKKQRMNVILLGHATVKTFNDPDGPSYDKYGLQMNQKAAAVWLAWADAVLFACYDVTVKSTRRANSAAKDTEKGKAVGEAKRVVCTTKAPAYDAKNRYNLPAELPLNWSAFSRAIRWDERDAKLVTPKPDPEPGSDEDIDEERAKERRDSLRRAFFKHWNAVFPTPTQKEGLSKEDVDNAKLEQDNLRILVNRAWFKCDSINDVPLDKVETYEKYLRTLSVDAFKAKVDKVITTGPEAK